MPHRYFRVLLVLLPTLGVSGTLLTTSGAGEITLRPMPPFHRSENTCLSVYYDGNSSYWLNSCSHAVSVRWDDPDKCRNWSCLAEIRRLHVPPQQYRGMLGGVSVPARSTPATCLPAAAEYNDGWGRITLRRSFQKPLEARYPGKPKSRLRSSFCPGYRPPACSRLHWQTIPSVQA